MPERRTTIEEVGKKATYAQAKTIHGGREPTTTSETLQQRTVTTSLTEGTVTLRYAPRTPKAGEPVDTAS